MASNNAQPHPTVAGNMFDPNVNADGQKAGRGVGGMQEQAVRDEGAEHIKKTAPDSGRGLGAGHSSTSSASGLGGSGVGGTSDQHVSTGGPLLDHSLSGTHSGAGSGIGSGSGSGLGSTFSTGASGSSGISSTGAGTTHHSTSNTSTTTGSDTNTSSGAGVNPTAGTSAGTDRATTAAEASLSATERRANSGDDATTGGPPPTIPMAGGQRIGANHWGESKVIPENPRVADADKNINTDATTASDAQHGHEHKHGFMDKIKDTLHLDHNKE